MDKNENELFTSLLSESKLEMPFSDFEDMVMYEIEQKEISKSSISKDLKLSLIFFVLGTIFGVVISILLQQLEKPVFGINPKVLSLFFQITFAVILFTQMEAILKLFKRSN